MPRNGSGTYQLPAGNPVVTGTPISSSVQNTTMSDVASALTTSICTDGQTPMAANLQMAGNKLIGLSAGAMAGDSLRFEQLFSQGVETTIASAATTDIGGQNTAFLNVTGTTSITSFGINFNGPRYLRFTGAVLITNSASLMTWSGANVTTVAGDILIAYPISTGWMLLNESIHNLGAISGVTSINGGQLAGLRNRLINGSMQVDQRNNGSSQTFTAAAAIAYCIDRWYASCTGANVTGQRVSTAGGYTITGLAANTGTLFGQRIESLNIGDLVNANITGSITASSTSITTLTWTAYSANAADNFSAKTQIATGTFTINSTPTSYNFTFNAGANAANGVAIEFTTGALVGSQTLTYGTAQLENGSTATFFERRLYIFERSLAQGYYRTGSFSYRWFNGGTSGFVGTIPIPTMRAIPTTTVATTTLLNANSVTSAALDITTITINASLPSSGDTILIGTFTASSEL